MGVTVSSHCVVSLRCEVSYSDEGEGGVAVNCEKNTIFPEHPVFNSKERNIFFFYKFSPLAERIVIENVA